MSSTLGYLTPIIGVLAAGALLAHAIPAHRPDLTMFMTVMGASLVIALARRDVGAQGGDDHVVS